MPKINVYLPEDLATAVRDAGVPVSAVCQQALERAVRDIASLQATDEPPAENHPGLGMLGRFTPRARKAITLAENAAREIPHNYVGTEHLLLGLADEGSNLAVTVLESLDIQPADLRAELLASMGPPSVAAPDRIAFTRLAKRALEATANEALGLQHNYIGCEHLLLGLLATEEGLASEVLRRMGVEPLSARRSVMSALASAVRTQPYKAPAPTNTDDTLQQILWRLDKIEQRLA